LHWLAGLDEAAKIQAMKQKRESESSSNEAARTDQDAPLVPANLDKLKSQLGELLTPKDNEQKQIAQDRTEPKS
jgi:hypothetical protein